MEEKDGKAKAPPMTENQITRLLAALEAFWEERKDRSKQIDWLNVYERTGVRNVCCLNQYVKLRILNCV